MGEALECSRWNLIAYNNAKVNGIFVHCTQVMDMCKSAGLGHALQEKIIQVWIVCYIDQHIYGRLVDNQQLHRFSSIIMQAIIYYIFGSHRCEDRFLFVLYWDSGGEPKCLLLSYLAQVRAWMSDLLSHNYSISSLVHVCVNSYK